MSYENRGRFKLIAVYQIVVLQAGLRFGLDVVDGFFDDFDGFDGFSGFSSSQGGFGGSQPYTPPSTEATTTIDMYTALLGGEIMVSMGDGQKLRLRGKGHGGTDLILTLQVKLPTTLTERQKELVRQMQQG